MGTWRPEPAGLILSGWLGSRKTSVLPRVGKRLLPAFWGPCGQASASSMRLCPGAPCEKGTRPPALLGLVQRASWGSRG